MYDSVVIECVIDYRLLLLMKMFSLIYMGSDMLLYMSGYSYDRL